MGFAIAQATAYRSTNAGGFAWVKGIHIETQMDALVAFTSDSQRLLQHRGKAQLVNIRHSEHVYSVGPQQLLFAIVNVTSADDHNFLHMKLGGPPTRISETTIAEARQRRQDHTVDVARRAGFVCIKIGMGVNPENADIRVNTGNTRDRAKCDTMIAAKDEWELLLQKCRSHVVCQFF